MKPTNSRPPMRLLAVDDEPANLTVIAGALFAENYEIRLAASAADARRVMAEWQPEVILLDVMMPGESGIELCQELRRDPAIDGIPIILVTALGASDHRTAGLEAGADDFIEKPIDIDELMSRTASWAARGRSPSPTRIPARFSGSAEEVIAAAAREASGKRDVRLLAAAMAAVTKRRR